MFQIRAFSTILVFLFCLFEGPLVFSGHAAEACEDWVGKVVSVQGEVQVLRAGKSQWSPISMKDALCPGDMIRVHTQSRAAIFLKSEAVIRLDQKTTVIFSDKVKESTGWLEMLNGAMHFFSSTFQRLKVVTPFVNAAVSGTEFYVGVIDGKTSLTIFEGRVSATNEVGSLVLSEGQSAVAYKGRPPELHMMIQPRDAVQWALYYPPIIDYQTARYGTGRAGKAYQQAIFKYREGHLGDAIATLDRVSESFRDHHFFTLRAGLLLSVGRIKEARGDIKQALDLNPADGTAIALKSIIAVAKNKKEDALSLARKAIEFEPRSPVPHIALSYALQAAFDIKNALRSTQEAVELAPENALAWARLTELWLSVGNLDQALDAARQATTLNPCLARTQTVLGFAYLTQIKVSKAQSAFEKAIELDPADPLPRLGMGLAKIRRGDLAQGRREIEIAMSLDPNNALIRSYLGKAYYEDKEDELAGTQFDIAKGLDPKDPTPWLYDAVRKQTVNRPVEALHDLQKSIELNDNRAVYRSRFLLDQDLAARSASLGRIYSDLGFEQMALVEGWKSLDKDPNNYSAHRLLADSYAALPRHEIARVSELLKSQLLQPLNMTPVQPQLAETNLFILEGVSPASPSFNEFNPLFLRDRLTMQLSGIAGNNDTFGNELVLSGIQSRFSYSIGQFHYETDGFRENNGLEDDIYTGLLQWSLFSNTGFQAEYRHTEREYGDLTLRFDPTDFSNVFKAAERSDTVRFGFRHGFSPHSNIIGSFIYQSFESDQKDLNAKVPDSSQVTDEKRDGYIAELQHLYRLGALKLVSGIGHYNQDVDLTIDVNTFFTIPGLPGKFPFQQRLSDPSDNRYSNLYSYAQISLPENFTVTLGLTIDAFDLEDKLDQDQVNPKLGVSWNPWEKTYVRLALTRVLSRTLRFNQTLEPTQIAGFNQFFDDILGTDVWRYGAAIDHQIFPKLYLGIEYSERDLEVPRLSLSQSSVLEDWEEQFGRAYLYWTPHPMWACRAEYQFERFDRSDGSAEPLFNEGKVDVKTHRVPLGVNFFHPSGFAAGFQASYIFQTGKFSTAAEGESPPIIFSDRDSFWVFDASLSYRFPKRRGIMSFGIRNILDEEFTFQDTDPDNPSLIPERILFAKFTLSF